MHMIEAALAFAVVMIIFSTVVSGLTETYIRITAIRPTALRSMIFQFVTEDPWIKERVRKSGEALANEADERIAKLVHELTDNPIRRQRWPWVDWLFNLLTREGSNGIDRLSTYGFFQRLARTEIGEGILEDVEKQGKAAVAATLRAIIMQYERYVATSNELFRKRSQAMTMVIAVVFAFGANVEAFRLFNYLSENPTVSQQLIAQVDQSHDANQVARARLADQLEQLGESEEDLKETTEAIQTTLTDMRKSLEEAKELSLPFGHEFSPFAKALGTDKADVTPEFDCASDYALWALSVLLAGFLIGLGGPFWYQFYSGLAALIRLPRAETARQELIQGKDDANQPGTRPLVKVLNDRTNGDGDLIALFAQAAGPPK